MAASRSTGAVGRTEPYGIQRRHGTHCPRFLASGQELSHALSLVGVCDAASEC